MDIISEHDSAQRAARLRRIPSVETLLLRPALQSLATRWGRGRVVASARAVIGQWRERIEHNETLEATVEALEAEVAAVTEDRAQYSLRPVINATGVILHTNLGRAPLALEAARHAMEIATQYSNLEYDLARGERGKRDVHSERLFADLLGADAALVVNNNAAAVYLALNTLAEGAEVIVSRGELVEIGGSFRIPDICAKSGAALREVGTTNRTRASDYKAAITERTRMLLRVHPSNFRMEGFTERPGLDELAQIARRHNLILMEDLGSGRLADLAPFGLREEPGVTQSLGAGADLVTFSGDKLAGGPQAGLLLGCRELLLEIRKNPLYRAFRAGKLTLAALEATLALYLREDYQAIPAQRMIRATEEEIALRAARLAERIACTSDIKLDLKDGCSVAGGGSTPGQDLPTKLIAAAHTRLSAQELAAALRANKPPIIARVEEDKVLLDLRTVLDEAQETDILHAFERLARC